MTQINHTEISVQAEETVNHSELPDGEVHIWHWDLDREEAPLALLSKDERERAGRFHLETDARRWAACRTLLRVTLGRYLAAAPESLRFTLGPWGKPGLHGCPLRFNVSHSGSAALLAVAWQREVGVDLEPLRRALSPEELAAQVLSLRERAWLRDQAQEERHAAFLTLWTAKEAYVKATGQGLSFPLTRLTLLPKWTSDQFQASQIVSLCPIFVQRLDAGPDYLAAVALEGTPAQVQYCTPGEAAGLALNAASGFSHTKSGYR